MRNKEEQTGELYNTDTDSINYHLQCISHSYNIELDYIRSAEIAIKIVNSIKAIEKSEV